MPILQAYNICHQFDNGDILFQQLSCAMTLPRVGLVGNNGVGKSVLAAILSGQQMPTSGTLNLPKSLAIYRQQPVQLLSSGLSVAQFLGKDQVLAALEQIAAGDYAEQTFDVVGEQWDLLERLTEQLRDLGLPPTPDFPCFRLSGGQLATLQLWQLFDSEAQLLILDEPSNHLDVHAKQWLLESMRAFNGAILLISHDRELLREMQEIWELSELGLQIFGGNYDMYAARQHTERQALARQLATVDKQKQQLAAQTQRSREKAQQRAAQGNKIRKEGGQPKILLDGKKDKASARTANQHKNVQLRQTHLQQKAQALKAREVPLKRQAFYLADSQSCSRNVISICNAVLPFGSQQPLTLQIAADDKVHLTGKNGCGKSTLLKILQGQLSFKAGELQLNTPLYYLDQHFSVIQPEMSILDNLMQCCQGMLITDARILLAGIGLRRDSVFCPAIRLSGGELMKLAMLIASHQAAQPFLLLDEPDNHLDLEAKILLAQALFNYRGGFILISHDTDFARAAGCQRQLALSA